MKQGEEAIMETPGEMEESTRARQHPLCWVCSPDNEHGLGVEFCDDSMGGVEGSFACDEAFTGYAGYLHGGVISSLLDGAMTNCLLSHGLIAVTADLQVRFHHPVRIGQAVIIRAWLNETRRLVYILGAELLQDGVVCATAVGRFMRHPQE